MVRIAACAVLLLCASSAALAAAPGLLDAEVASNGWETYYTLNGLSATHQAGAFTQLQLNSEQLQQYGPSFTNLDVEVTPETASRLHVKVKPTGQQRWEVPESIVPRPSPDAGLRSEDLLYQVQEISSSQPFALTVTRTSSSEPVFDTRGFRLLFKDQYLELTTALPADADLYGLGEVSLPTGLLLPRDGTIITLWARDYSSAAPYANLYGAHPFYLQINKDGSSQGVLLLNSNGMDVVLNPTSLTYRAIGGLLDLYFFMGPSPEAVIQQYHQVIGPPALPPYWALGFHQTKWGYSSVSVVEDVVANYTAAGLPLEVLWSDIDYQNNRFKTMEFDPDRYPVQKMRGFVDGMHSRGQHWMPLVNAGVAASKGFRAYDDGSREDIWIKDHTGKEFVGQVWPGMAVFPDYLEHPRADAWLQRQLAAFYQQVPFSGLWLDMNEAANFCTGYNCELDSSNATALHYATMRIPKDGNIADTRPLLSVCMLKCQQAAKSDKLYYPPYKIHNMQGLGVRNADLASNIISPSAVHANGALEYDAHNLFGAAMARSHHAAVVAVTGKRPFMLSRSTFPGSGRYTAHWTGDNAANWQSLYMSVAGIINTNMWGISMVGADICGFIDAVPSDDPWGETGKLPDDEYEQLCNRWASAGAFYPFSRNHMGYPTRNHEFYRWPAVAASAKKAYGLRYQLLTYLYSSLFVAHSRGGTLARPLLFTDPSDTKARNATKQWMMGEALLISPVLEKDTTSIDAYFTEGSWYSAWDYSRLTVTTGQSVKLQVPLGEIAVHYRGGSIVPLQQFAAVTRDIRFSPVTLVVALPASPSTDTALATAGPLPAHGLEAACAAAHKAHAGQLVSCGFLFMDAEADLPEVSADNSVQAWFVAVATPDGTSGMVRSSLVANNGEAAGRLRIEALHVLGVPTAAAEAGAAATAVVVTPAGTSRAAEVNAAAGTLKITGLYLIVGEELELQWRLE